MRTTLALIVLAVLTAGLGRLCYLAHPFDDDAAVFIYMGKLALAGGRLGHDLVDNKLPTVGLVMAGPSRLFGNHWPAYVLTQFFLSMGATGLLTAAAPRSRLAVAVFSLTFLNFTPAVFGGFQLETVQVFFISTAAWCGARALVRLPHPVVRERVGARVITGDQSPGRPGVLPVDDPLALTPSRYAAKGERNFLRLSFSREFGGSVGVGVFSALAACCKPTGLAFAAAWIFSAILCRRPRAILGLFTGLMIPAAGVVAYLVHADLLAELPAQLRQISTYANHSVFDWIDAIKLPTAAAVLGLPFLLNRGNRVTTPVPVFLSTWLAIETIGIVAQRRMYAYHFLPLVPPAALLFGHYAGDRLRPLLLAVAPVVLLGAAAAVNVVRTPASTAPAFVIDYLKTHADPNDAVWIEQYPRVLLATDLRPGSRFASTFLFCNYDSAGDDYSAVILSDFDAIRPRYIVLPADVDRFVESRCEFIPELKDRPARAAAFRRGWRRIRRYVETDYRPVADDQSQIVYRRVN